MNENVKKEVERITEEEINGRIVSKQPLCILIGGLPGAGKTNLVKKIQEMYKEHDFVIIDADNYRTFCPNYEKLKKTPEKAIAATSEFSNEVEAELIKKAIEKGCDIISVTTLRATEAINKLVYEPATEAGYEIEIHIIAAPLEECGLSAQIRYEKQIQKGECPRFTPMSFIESSQNGIKSTIKWAHSKENICGIKIYNRGLNEYSMPIEVYGTEVDNKLYNNEMEAFLKAPRRYDEKLAINQINRLYRIKQMRNANIIEFESLKRLLELYDYEIDLVRISK